MPIPGWKQIIVRVRNQLGSVVGAGFLVSPDLIVTCAHVVADAIGEDESEKLPDDLLTVDFAFIPEAALCTAKVVVWKSDDLEVNDLALLQFVDQNPSDFKIPPLHLSDTIDSHTECQTYGFPPRDDDGLNAIAKVIDMTASGLIQLEAPNADGQIVEKGFSGAPVWSDELNAIIGVIVSVKPKTTVSLAIPAYLVREMVVNFGHTAVRPALTSIPQKKLDTLINLVLQKPDPVLLLGAGGSHKSGIPLTDDLVARAARYAYGREHNRLNDPTIRRSDWLEWLESLDWYDRYQMPVNQYISVMRHLFREEERIHFLRQICRPDVEPGLDYRNLVRLLSEQRISTILTTNFDDILISLLDQVSSPPSYYLAGPHKAIGFSRISTAPRYPQIIQLFGDYEYYAMNHFSSGENLLDPSLQQVQDRLVAFLRDHPIIVIGYSGRENSIIDGLFLDNIERADYFRNGIYWCVWQQHDELHPNVIRLANAIGDNFYLVPIPSHEYLIEKFVNVTQGKSIPVPHEPEDSGQHIADTEDMHVLHDCSLEDLDWNEVKTRVPEYCHKTKIGIPTRISDEWLRRVLLDQDFIRFIDGDYVPTIAGYILFGSNQSIREKYPDICIELRLEGENTTFFHGNLWHQLQLIDILETEFNQPYRLKGVQSQTVTPYPSLAIKELVVNALAHRKYLDSGTNQPSHVIITVDNDFITVINPGGLHRTIYRQLPDTSNPEQYLGIRKLKGYRNPVVAHFLYSTGDMDRLGSGLIDVRKAVRQNEGNVTFRIAPDDFFEVTLYRRLDNIDETTGAARNSKPETRFISNLFEVSQLPPTVYFADTTYRRVPDIFQETNEHLPAYVLYDGQLYTFSNLFLENNPLRKFVATDTNGSIPTSEFSANELGQRRLVNLLNQALAFFFWDTDLWFDWGRKRAYFPRQDNESEDRKITYQARVRQAERTVVKARKSPLGKIQYWEHLAIEFFFKKFGDTWAVQILPTYVFTEDGYKSFLSGDRSGPMATRKLSREYNQHVDNHLTFWSRILSNSEGEIVLENLFESYLALKDTPTDILLTGSPLGIDDEHIDDVLDELAELEEDLEEQLLTETMLEDEDESDD